MSVRPIDHSPDLQHLRAEGFEIRMRSNHLLLSSVPYVTPERTVGYCTLIAPVSLSGETALKPQNHVVYFQGEHFPCDADGKDLREILSNGEGPMTLAEGLVTSYTFSAKPQNDYENFYDKMVAYVQLLGKYVERIDAKATAITWRVPPSDRDDDSVFLYPETASTRAGIGAIVARLALQKVAIVGLGGTGSYILDLVAKTPVKEIHLYDDDGFANHNAFRAPGATSRDELFRTPPFRKVEYFAQKYSAMRRGVVAHSIRVDASNVADLVDADFVFLSMDPSEAKRDILRALEEAGRPFIDVGMGIGRGEGLVGGVLRTTLSTQDFRKHRNGPSLSNVVGEYDNVQVAELNALNAVIAVIRWKKLYGFYLDVRNEHSSLYTIDVNELTNDDFGEATSVPA